MTRKAMWFLVALLMAMIVAPVALAQTAGTAARGNRLGGRGRRDRSWHRGCGLRNGTRKGDRFGLRGNGAQSGSERSDPHRVHHRRGAD